MGMEKEEVCVAYPNHETKQSNFNDDTYPPTLLSLCKKMQQKDPNLSPEEQALKQRLIASISQQVYRGTYDPNQYERKFLACLPTE